MKSPAQGTAIERLVSEVRNMRDAQRRFFKAERASAAKHEAFKESKVYENRVDAILAEIDADAVCGQEKLSL